MQILEHIEHKAKKLRFVCILYIYYISLPYYQKSCRITMGPLYIVCVSVCVQGNTTPSRAEGEGTGTKGVVFLSVTQNVE